MSSFKFAFALLVSAAFLPSAFAQSATNVRLAPVLGQSSFANDTTIHTDQFAGLSGGVFVDFGASQLNFETGILSLNSNVVRNGNTTSVSVNTYGVPVLAKYNLSVNPQSTVFIKAGGMPFISTGSNINTFSIMAVGGVGGTIPIGSAASIILDATYNRMFLQSGDYTNYQGLALLAGLSFNI